MQYVIFIVLVAGLAAGLYLWIDTGNAAVLKVLAVWVIVVIFMLTGIPSAKKNEDGYVDLDDIPGRPPKRPLPPSALASAWWREKHCQTQTAYRRAGGRSYKTRRS